MTDLEPEHKEEIRKEAVEAVKRPVRSISFLTLLFFVLILGGGVFLGKLNTTMGHVKHTVNHIDRTVVHVDKSASNTDQIVSKVTGPEAQKQQQEAQSKIVDALVSQMDCQDQLNLQRLLDNLVEAGMTQFAEVDTVVEPSCIDPPQGGTP